MPRILIFSLSYYPTRVGGAEVAIAELTKRMPDIAFDMVTLRIDKRLPRMERIGNVTVHRVGLASDIRELSGAVPLAIRIAKALFPIEAFLEGARLHRTHRYDGVWAMMAAYAGFAALFFKLRYPRVPYLLTLQEGDPIPYILKKVRLVRPLFTRIFTKADEIQAISTFLGRWAKDMGYAGPVSVIPNGVDTEHFSRPRDPEELARARTTLGKRDGDVFLITTSRLFAKNALDQVVRALPLLPAHVRFAILGTGPEEPMLRALASELGVASRVVFLGQVGHDVLPDYLASSDIFVRPSRSEGMGNSFIEAMAAGLPVIATQEGGIADFLFDAERNPERSSTGWAVDVDSPEQIARAVERILSSLDETARVRANAKELASTRYDWNTLAPQMHAVFMRLLESKV